MKKKWNTLCVLLLVVLAALTIKDRMGFPTRISQISDDWTKRYIVGFEDSVLRFKYRVGNDRYGDGNRYRIRLDRGHVSADSPLIRYRTEAFWWFAYDTRDTGYYSDTMVTVPLWVLYVLVAVLPVWTFVAWYRRRRRHIPGHAYCDHCNYDLHGINAKQCPECGEQIAPQKQLSTV